MTSAVKDPLLQQIDATLHRVLCSPLFRKAHRSRRLLEYLVDQWKRHALRELTEYAIGIGAFDRDPTSYNTNDDPIVRVQIGRLREKLKFYYLQSFHRDDVVISIPSGSYVPAIGPVDHSARLADSNVCLTWAGFRNVGEHCLGTAFAEGLSEELAYRMFRKFGSRIVPYRFSRDQGLREMATNYLVEGSVRIEGTLIRAAVRLIDATGGAIALSEQWDRHGNPDIALQEELAQAICARLGDYQSHG